ncbi:unnamed protein product, partial [Mesorhabditis spiculigera]
MKFVLYLAAVFWAISAVICVSQPVVGLKLASENVREACEWMPERPIDSCFECCQAVRAERKYSGRLVHEILIPRSHCSCCFGNDKCLTRR